jgi:hypothetical protein
VRKNPHITFVEIVSWSFLIPTLPNYNKPNYLGSLGNNILKESEMWGLGKPPVFSFFYPCPFFYLRSSIFGLFCLTFLFQPLTCGLQPFFFNAFILWNDDAVVHYTWPLTMRDSTSYADPGLKMRDTFSLATVFDSEVGPAALLSGFYPSHWVQGSIQSVQPQSLNRPLLLQIF